GQVGQSSAECVLPAQATPWMNWLWARSCLLRWARGQSAPFAGKLPWNQLALAWSVDCWWSLYGKPGDQAPNLVHNCRHRLPRLLERLPVDAGALLMAIWRVRAGEPDAVLLSTASPADTEEIWDIGALGEEFCRTELGLETTYRNARRQLAAGN